MKNILDDIKRNWLTLSLSLLLFGLAAIFNSIMDTLVHHYSVSVFANLDPQWWNPAISWENKYTQPINLIFLTDAWHLFKTLMIGTIAYTFIFLGRRIPVTIGRIIVYTILYGLAWNLTFNLFYDKIWR